MIFLHISDLHIGLADPSTNFNAPIPRYSRYLEKFKGQFGHHYRALLCLQEFYEGLVQAGEKVQLIMSGDATSFGKPAEFDNANAFLAGTLHGCGLNIKKWRNLAIPGNHDHWPGSPRILGRSTAGLRRYFPEARYPSCTRRVQISRRHFLRFIAINTDANVWPYGPSRFLARGAFHSQLAKLDNTLPMPVRGEIRALVLHHSALYVPPNGGKELTMRTRSRRALDSFLVNHEISVMMCGHTHEIAKVDHFTAQASNGLTRTVVECCCGTTTQRDRFPSGFAELAGGFPTWSLDPNSLLVHRFEPTQTGHVELKSQSYVLTPTGFNPYGVPTSYEVA